MYPGEEATQAIIQHMTKHKDINRNKQILILHFNFSMKIKHTQLMYNYTSKSKLKQPLLS